MTRLSNRAGAKLWIAVLLFGLASSPTIAMASAAACQDVEYQDLLDEVNETLELLWSPDPDVLEEASGLMYDLATELDDVLRELDPVPDAHAETLVYSYLTLALVPAGPFSDDLETEAVLEQAREFLEVWTAPRSHYWHVQLEYMAAVRWMGRGEQTRALDHLTEARRLASRVPELKSMILAARADLIRRDGRWSDALDVLREADAEWNRLPEARRRSEPAMVGRCDVLGVRGQVYAKLGLADVAMSWYQQEAELAERVLRDHRNSTPRQAAAGRLGALLVFVSRPERALREVESALEDPRLDPTLAAGLLGVRAKALAMMTSLDSTQFEVAEAAMQDALAAPDLASVDRLHLQLERAALWIRLGRFDQATTLLQELRASEPELDRDLIEPTLERAFLTALRARIALQREDDRAALLTLRDELSASYAEFLTEWQESPLREGGLNYLRSEWRRAVLSELIRLTRALEPEHPKQALNILVQAQTMSTVARRVGARGEFRPELLEGGGGVLMYLPTWERTHVFAVDAAGVVHEELAGWSQLEPVVARVQQSLQREASAAELVASAAPLGEQLFPDAVGQRLQVWRAVQIVGAELLGDLPFECVPHGSRALGLSKALSYLPSVPLGGWLVEQREQRSTSEQELLLIVARDVSAELTNNGPQLRPIPFGATEQGRLTDPFERAEVLLDPETAHAGLQAAERQRPAILHALCHGVYSPRLHQLAGLALAASNTTDPGILWSEQVRRSQLAGMVILSACGGARGPERLGEGGLENLGGAFLEAGASAVVLATADVDFQTTVRLMEALHAELAAGHTVAEALRRARITLAAGNPDALPVEATRFRVMGLGAHRPFPH